MSLLAAPGVGPAVYPPRNILASGPSTVAQQFERRLVMRCQYLLGSICRGCYRGHMSTFRYDYDSLAGMPAASTVSLSCADTMSANAAGWTTAEDRDVRKPMCLRLLRHPSAPAVGACPGRKQGPEEKSHKNLSFAVVAARNVV